jgi:hypothetical protein
VLAYLFLEIPSLQKKVTETLYFLVVTPYSELVVPNGLIHEFFLGLTKIQIFAQYP